MVKKRILVTAGGTATAWHICTIIRRYFSDDFELHLCDINPPELIPASVYADKYHIVPLINSDKYEEFMYHLFDAEKIDIIVPLIDNDLFIFSQENPELMKRNICTTAPFRKTIETLSDKYNLSKFLSEHNIATPEIYQLNQLNPNTEYVIKSKVGFGSRSFRKLLGSKIPDDVKDDDIIQELCISGDKPEVTAEVFCTSDRVKIFCRERREVKSGVCTKMIPIEDADINNVIIKLCSLLSMPRAFCIQFMWHNSHWNVIDCNLRLGAGTALSTAAGFQLTKALLLSLLGLDVPDSLFEVDSSIKSVLRVYDEIVIR